MLDTKLELYSDLADDVLSGYKTQIENLEGLAEDFEAGKVPDILWGEANYKVTKLLPEKRQTLATLTEQRAMYESAKQKVNPASSGPEGRLRDKAVSDLLTMRKLLPNQNYEVVEVVTPSPLDIEMALMTSEAAEDERKAFEARKPRLRLAGEGDETPSILGKAGQRKAGEKEHGGQG